MLPIEVDGVQPSQPAQEAAVEVPAAAEPPRQASRSPSVEYIS